MKFIWEPKDFEGGANWGMMAKRGDELVIIGGTNVTSLRDGHQWSYETKEDMAENFNTHGYIPVFAQINPSVIIKEAAEASFGYGICKTSKGA